MANRRHICAATKEMQVEIDRLREREREATEIVDRADVYVIAANQSAGRDALLADMDRWAAARS